MTSIAYASRPKGPQPILDNFTEPEDLSDVPSDITPRPVTAPHLERPVPPYLHLNRSSTQTSPERKPPTDSDDANGALDGRPKLPRAKSDFGPRRDEQKTTDDESRTSVDGEWGIRHGFETQLVSEEYNNLLNSVSFFNRLSFLDMMSLT